MQLRKVCNHPNLFEVRPTISPFQMEGITYETASLIMSVLDYDPFKVSGITRGGRNCSSGAGIENTEYNQKSS